MPSADLHLWGVGGGKRYWAALSRRGHRVPPREWSRGESGVGGGRGLRGARANLRRLSETSETAGSSGSDGPSLRARRACAFKLIEMWSTIYERQADSISTLGGKEERERLCDSANDANSNFMERFETPK